MNRVFNLLKNSTLLTVVFCVAQLTAFANETSTEGHEKAEGEEELNVTEVILHHVSDSHEFHLWGKGEDAVSIYLPVILWTDHGLDVFMSGGFYHGDGIIKTDKGEYQLHHEKVHYAGNHAHGEEHAGPLDFSITKNVFAMLFSFVLLFLIFTSVARAYKKRGDKAPKGMQNVMETLILFVRDEIAIPNIGEKKASRFLPYLLTVFFFIWINNLLGLVPIFPGSANLSGNISFTLTLAVLTFLITTFSGNKGYWKHIFATPGVPVWLAPIMIPVEIIGMFTKPFALTIRLFANITAGHIVVLSLVSLIFIFKTANAAFVSVPFALFISVLELLVAFLQAYVFTLLSALFIGMAVEDHDHH